LILATALSTNDWKGKKVVLFAVPGAFTVSVCAGITREAAMWLIIHWLWFAIF
jgi:peroxiredoxin